MPALLSTTTTPVGPPIAIDYVGDRLLRLPEVIRVTGVSRSTIYSWMQQGLFVPSVKVGPRAVAWRASAIREFLVSREKPN